MKKKVLLLFFVMMAYFSVFSQQPKNKLGSYTQVRYTTDFAGSNAVELRRLKFKLASTPAFSQHFSYYVKAEVSSSHEAKFSLLDMRLGYNWGNFTIYAGQFLPDFSLERFQSDAQIPTIERSVLIDNFLPTANIGVRDLGVQIEYDTKDNFFHSSIGLFNGRSIKYWTRNNNGFLLTHKTMFDLKADEDLGLQLGYSIAYRRAEDLPMPKVLPDTLLFTGNDIRLNLFSKVKFKNFSLQGEWIKGWVNQQIAQGYYVLADFTLDRHQIAFSYDRFIDLIADTEDYPWFYLGYNYLIDSCYTKVSTAFRFQYDGKKILNPLFSIQFQIFLFR